MKKLLFALTLLLVACTTWASTTFTYQGQLSQPSGPFSGSVDLEFRLFTQATGGSQIGDVVEHPNWPVQQGLFQVELDFGSEAFAADPRYLEIRVDGNTLSPRQPVRPTPVAMYALEAAQAPATWPVDRGAPGHGISQEISNNLDSIDALAATHDVTGRLVVAVRDSLGVHVVRCINIHCEGGDRTITLAPDAANTNSPVDILVGPGGTTFIAYGSLGNQLVVARCTDETCTSLQTTFFSPTLVSSIVDLSMVVQQNNRMAVAVTLATGGNLIYRCSNEGCTDAEGALVSTVAGATRISATNSGLVFNSIAVVTTHTDETLRIHRCANSNSDCTELAVIEDVSFEDGIHAQTTANGLPVMAFWRHLSSGNPELHTARCGRSTCTVMEVVSTHFNTGNDSSRQVIAGTLLPAGHPVFALSFASSRLLQCADSSCVGRPNQFSAGGFFAEGLRAATVGPEGTLVLVGQQSITSTAIRTFRCTNGPACMPHFRPR